MRITKQIAFFLITAFYYAAAMYYFDSAVIDNVLHFVIYGVLVSASYHLTVGRQLAKGYLFDESNFLDLIRYFTLGFVLSTVVTYSYNLITSLSTFNLSSYSSLFVDLSIISILPVIVGLYFYEKFLIKVKYQLINFESKDADKESKVSVNSDSQKKSLDLNIDNLLLVQGADNYCVIYFKEGETVKKELFRCTLKSLHNQIENFDGIYRCHRSYIINVNNVSEIKGKSQSYKICFEGVDVEAPVSRSFDISVISV